MRAVGNAESIARRRRTRIAVRVTASIVLLALAAGALAIWVLGGTKRAIPSDCFVVAGTSHYQIDTAQAENATTIAAVGKRLGLPDHAVTVALAAALQESRLTNIAYGDRDSLGLFQQRPSQGWGTPAQIMRPPYAAKRFFAALEHVPGWQTMSVTDAAQAVQHSDAPQAYASWEPLARTLAVATTGEVAAGLSCEFPLPRPKGPVTSPISVMTQETGPLALRAPGSRKRGWLAASWLVGHAQRFGITSVTFGTHRWTPHGSWTTTATAQTGIQITQAPAT